MRDGTPLSRARARRKLGPTPERLAALRQVVPEVTMPREPDGDEEPVPPLVLTDPPDGP